MVTRSTERRSVRNTLSHGSGWWRSRTTRSAAAPGRMRPSLSPRPATRAASAVISPTGSSRRPASLGAQHAVGDLQLVQQLGLPLGSQSAPSPMGMPRSGRGRHWWCGRTGAGCLRRPHQLGARVLDLATWRRCASVSAVPWMITVTRVSSPAATYAPTCWAATLRPDRSSPEHNPAQPTARRICSDARRCRCEQHRRWPCPDLVRGQGLVSTPRAYNTHGS